MDTATLIIAAILLAICILPFVLISRNRKKNERALLQSLKNLAQNVQCTIDQHEFCGDVMIGLDATKNIIFYIKKGVLEDEYKYVVLDNFQQCEIVKTMKNISESSIIDTLELKFTPISGKSQLTSLEFYDSNVRFQLNGELQMTEKWFKIISDKMKK